MPNNGKQKGTLPGHDAVVGRHGKLEDVVDDIQGLAQAVKHLVEDGALAHAHDAVAY